MFNRQQSKCTCTIHMYKLSKSVLKTRIVRLILTALNDTGRSYGHGYTVFILVWVGSYKLYHSAGVSSNVCGCLHAVQTTILG